jgi:lysozyme
MQHPALGNIRAMSPAGIEQLIAEEGEVLRAYRDVAGVWTIGVGLTAASGVIAPVAGMTITQRQSRSLLAEALGRRYEPAVAAAMPGATQPAFDGGVSFHFNTGAIGRASWVAAWRRGDRAAVRTGLAAWNKAGGRVVEGLVRRRAREADLILDGRREVSAATLASLRRGDRGEAVRLLQSELIRLGVLAGAADGVFGPMTEEAVRAFQSAHPQLAVDGIAGRATTAQIARLRDVRQKAMAAAAGGAVATGGGAIAASREPGAGEAIPADGALAASLAILCLAALLWLAWRYRDEILTLVTLKRRS